MVKTRKGHETAMTATTTKTTTKKNLLKYPNIHYLKAAMPEEQSISTNM